MKERLGKKATENQLKLLRRVIGIWYKKNPGGVYNLKLEAVRSQWQPLFQNMDKGTFADECDKIIEVYESKILGRAKDIDEVLLGKKKITELVTTAEKKLSQKELRCVDRLNLPKHYRDKFHDYFRDQLRTRMLQDRERLKSTTNTKSSSNIGLR